MRPGYMSLLPDPGEGERATERDAERSFPLSTRLVSSKLSFGDSCSAFTLAPRSGVRDLDDGGSGVGGRIPSGYSAGYGSARGASAQPGLPG